MNRLLKHVFFWLFVFFFYSVYFGAKSDSLGQSIFFVGFFLPITIITTYSITYWLIPRYLTQDKIPHFILYCTYLLLISIYAELAAFLGFYLVNKSFQSIFTQPLLLNLLDILVGMYIVVFAGVSIHLVQKWRQSEYRVRLHRSKQFKAENELEHIIQGQNRILTVRVDREDHHIPEKDIVYIESQRDYALLHLKNKSVLTKRTLTSLANDLNPDDFVRIHRSYLVQIRSISSSSSTEIQIGNLTLPIGRSYRAILNAKLRPSSQ